MCYHHYHQLCLRVLMIKVTIIKSSHFSKVTVCQSLPCV